MNVTAYDTSSSSLNISWIPIPEWYHEGVLLGYVIFFEVKEGFTDIRRGRTKGEHYCNTSSCELTDLSLHTPYVIYVAGYTDAGYGVLSVVANGTTGEFSKFCLLSKNFIRRIFSLEQILVFNLPFHFAKVFTVILILTITDVKELNNFFKLMETGHHGRIGETVRRVVD